MLIAHWTCTLCGWQGETKDLKTNNEGHKVCPNCEERRGLE